MVNFTEGYRFSTKQEFRTPKMVDPMDVKFLCLFSVAIAFSATISEIVDPSHQDQFIPLLVWSIPSVSFIFVFFEYFSSRRSLKKGRWVKEVNFPGENIAGRPTPGSIIRIALSDNDPDLKNPEVQLAIEALKAHVIGLKEMIGFRQRYKFATRIGKEYWYINGFLIVMGLYCLFRHLDITDGFFWFGIFNLFGGATFFALHAFGKPDIEILKKNPKWPAYERLIAVDQIKVEEEVCRYDR